MTGYGFFWLLLQLVAEVSLTQQLSQAKMELKQSQLQRSKLMDSLKDWKWTGWMMKDRRFSGCCLGMGFEEFLSVYPQRSKIFRVSYEPAALG